MEMRVALHDQLPELVSNADSCGFPIPTSGVTGHFLIWDKNMKTTVLVFAICIIARPSPAQVEHGVEHSKSGGEFEEVRSALKNALPAAKHPAMTLRGGVCYAAPTGSDENEGLSWDSAKGSIMGCYDSLTRDGGTIYFSEAEVHGAPKLVSACPAGDPPGCGIWIMGHGDPNFAHPPAGWRIAKRSGVNFVGVGGTNFGANSHDGPKVGVTAGGAERSLPSIWLSGVNNITFANMTLHASARPIVVGEDSVGNRSGSGNCASITFTNVDPNILNYPGNGPGFDITGNSFWIWIKNSLATGFYANAVTANNRAAILLDGAAGTGVGLIYISDTNVNGGGVKYVPGTNPGSLVVHNLTIEGDFSHDIPPAVWMSGSGTANGTTLFADSVTVADPGPSGAVAVQIDGGLPDNSAIVGAVGGGHHGRNVQGPATIISQFQSPNLGSTNDDISPLRGGQAGFFLGHAVGQQDSARRSFAPVATRFKNLAPQAPSAWSPTHWEGITTYTQGILAPDGTQNAARASNTGKGTKQILYFLNQSQSISAGEWFIGGAWVRSQTANGYAQSNTQGLALALAGAGAVTTGQQSHAVNKGDGEWEWQWVAQKIIASSTGKAVVQFGATFDNVHAIEAYAPVFLHVPTRSISDNEAYEVAMNLQTYADTATPGDVSMLRNQRLSIGGSTEFFAKLTHSCKADCIQNFPNASGPNDLAATNLPQDWIQPQRFASGASFGNGNLLSRYAVYSAVLSPRQVAANTCAAQTFTVKNILSPDVLIAVNKPSEQAGLAVMPGHVEAQGRATINFCNNTVSTIQPTAEETYRFVVVE